MRRFANPVFVAIDTPDLSAAIALGRSLVGYVGGLKVGLEFVNANGPEGVKAIVALGAPVFLDVKFHDIPNTVAGASRAVANLGTAIFNVHASGGAAMLRAAKDAVKDFPNPPAMIAVTVLTSIDDAELDRIGQKGPPLDQVLRLAKLTKDSGGDGVVCSPQEIKAVRAACGPDFLIVTPGIRPAGADLADQKRVMTPAEAMAAGADILVIGRPITGAKAPAQAAQEIVSGLTA